MEPSIAYFLGSFISIIVIIFGVTYVIYKILRKVKRRKDD